MTRRSHWWTWTRSGERERDAGLRARHSDPVASKSVRCRPLLAEILDGDPGFRGLMTVHAAGVALADEHGFEDLLLAYPTAHRGALAELGRLESETCRS